MININDLAKEVNKACEAYADDVNRKLKEIIPGVAKETAQELKTTSPKHTGKYASGWGVKNESSRLATTATVYNKRRYRLTHLLEKGHASRGGGRTVPPKPHIGKAEQKAINDVIKRIKAEL